MSPTKMLGTDGTKAFAPSTVQRSSARTSSRPIALGPGADIAVACPTGQVAPDARIRLRRRGAGGGVHNAVEHLSLRYDPVSLRLFGVPIVATVREAAGVAHVLATDAVVVDAP